VKPVDHVRRRTPECEADHINLGRFDDLQLGVKGIVIPAWLAERDAETFCFGLQHQGVLDDLAEISGR